MMKKTEIIILIRHNMNDVEFQRYCLRIAKFARESVSIESNFEFLSLDIEQAIKDSNETRLA